MGRHHIPLCHSPPYMDLHFPEMLCLCEDYLCSHRVTAGDPQFDFWVRKIPWRRDWLPTPVFLGCPGGSDGKESFCNLGDLGSNPGLERSPGEGKGYPHQYSGLENPHGQRSLVGCSPWGFKESNMTE